jgi:hypothetical protein
MILLTSKASSHINSKSRCSGGVEHSVPFSKRRRKKNKQNEMTKKKKKKRQTGSVLS